MAIRNHVLATTFLMVLASCLGRETCACDEPQEVFRYEAIEEHMGVRFQITLYAPDDERAREGMRAAFDTIAQLDRRLSDFKPESEVSRLSVSAPHDEPQPISDELHEVLTASLEVASRSDGCFDPTVGPLTQLWRESKQSGRLPNESVLQAAMDATGFDALQLCDSPKTVRLTRANMRLDFGGIAKGYAADRALATLRKLGINRALINASGDVTLGDAPPGRDGWTVGVAPLDPTEAPSRILTLANCSIATSGDAWQSVDIGGRHYSHIVDPRTGLGLTQRSSVTVIAENGMLADAWASAVSVLGPAEGLRVINSIEHIEAFVVIAVDNEPRAFESSDFPEANDQEHR